MSLPEHFCPFCQPLGIAQNHLHQFGVIKTQGFFTCLGKNDPDLAIFVPLLYQTRAPFWFAKDSDPVTTIVIHRCLPDLSYLHTILNDLTSVNVLQQIVNRFTENFIEHD